MDRHTLAVSQSQGNATADYPPSPSASKHHLSCLVTDMHCFLMVNLSGSFVFVCALISGLLTFVQFQQIKHLSSLDKSLSEISTLPAALLCFFTLCALAFSSAAHQQQLEITDLGPTSVSSGVKWFHGYKYDTAHKQVLGYKGLACICTTPSFSCAAWITYCTADTSILCWSAISGA